MKTLGFHKIHKGIGRAPAVPFIALAIAVIGTAAATYSQVQQSQYQKAMGKYQAGVAKNNVLYSERAAHDAEVRGEMQARDQRVKATTLISDQQSQLAGNGVDVTGTSALGTYNDTFNAGEEDAMTIQQNANREALGYRQQGANFSAQQAAALSQGNNLDYLGTAFSGVGSVADKWYQLDQSGAFATTTGGGFAAPAYGSLRINSSSGQISGGI